MQRSSAYSLSALDVSSALKVVSGCSQGVLRVADLLTGAAMRSQQVHARGVTSVSFSPRNPRLLMSAGSDGLVCLVDLASRNTTSPSASIGSASPITALCFHDNAVNFAAASASGDMLLYDWRYTKSALASAPSGSGAAVVELRFQRDELGKSVQLSQLPVDDSPSTRRRLPDSLGLPGKENDEFWIKQRRSRDVTRPLEDTMDTVALLGAGKLHIGEDVAKWGSLEASTQVAASRESAYVEPLESTNFEALRKAVRPVNSQELSEAMAMLKYEMHREVQSIIYEQVRQFELAKVINILTNTCNIGVLYVLTMSIGG